MKLLWLSTFFALCACAADYSAPAGTKPAIARHGLPSILPGGRVIVPAGRQFVTGPGPYGLAISPDHTTLVSVNSGPERFSVTVIELDKKAVVTRNFVASIKRPTGTDREEQEQWRSVFMGVAFSGNRAVYVSEGNSGRVRLMDLSTGDRRKLFDLNQNGFPIAARATWLSTPGASCFMCSIRRISAW